MTVSHAIVILLIPTCQLAPKSNSHISHSFVASVYKPVFFQCSIYSTLCSNVSRSSRINSSSVHTYILRLFYIAFSIRMFILIDPIFNSYDEKRPSIPNTETNIWRNQLYVTNSIHDNWTEVLFQLKRMILIWEEHVIWKIYKVFEKCWAVWEKYDGCLLVARQLVHNLLLFLHSQLWMSWSFWDVRFVRHTSLPTWQKLGKEHTFWISQIKLNWFRK